MNKSKACNILKFYLGMECVVKFEDQGYVVTKRKFFYRVFRHQYIVRWETLEYVRLNCVFKTREDAEKARKIKLFMFE